MERQPTNSCSVLFVIDGEEPIKACLDRALMLARVLQARLDILLWRGWSTYYSKLRPWGADQGCQYLHALRHSVLSAGVEITTQATFGGTLSEVVAEKIRQLNSVLVIKVRRHGLSWRGSIADRDLVHVCSAPLLLTDGRPWGHRPRFAAAVNVLKENLTNDRNIIETIGALQRVCAADLDLIYAEPADAMPRAPQGESPAQLLLQNLASECHVTPQRIHVLDGRVAHVLPRFISAMRYDLLAIGSPATGSYAFRHLIAPALSESLIKTGCDLLAINPDHGQLTTALACGREIAGNRPPTPDAGRAVVPQ
jgi:hypothetical protein